jgi:hypothetical protein
VFVRTGLILVALALGLVAVGCGGGGRPTTTQTQTVTTQGKGGAPTKAKYIKQADAICQRLHAETRSLSDRYRDLAARAFPTDAEIQEAADIVRHTADSARKAAQELQALTPPNGDADIINNWLTTGESGIPLNEQLADAIENQDAGQMNTLTQQIASANDKADGIAQGYGFKVCGSE